MNTQDGTEQVYIPYMLSLARSGCKFSAQFLATVAAGYIRSGNPLPPALREWIAEALTTGGKGGSVDKSLCLKNGRGKGETAYYKQAALAHAVYRKIKDGEAITVEDACRMVEQNGAKTTKGDLVYASYSYIYKSFYKLRYHKL